MYTMKEKMGGKIQQKKEIFKKSSNGNSRIEKKILNLRADKLNNRPNTA